MSGPHAQEISLRAPAGSATASAVRRLARHLADGDRPQLAAAQEISLAPARLRHPRPPSALARHLADGDRARLARHLAAEVREISG